MSIKTFALVAATIVATASTASADSYFGDKGALEAQSNLELGLIRAEGDGVVEIYDFRRGEIGALLGTETVNAGANSDVRVGVGIAPTQDVVAQLKVDGEVVAQHRYFVNN